LHWVSATDFVSAKVNIYDRLFLEEDPLKTEDEKSFLDNINPDSLKTIDAILEPSLKNVKAEDHFQFERLGYFCVDKENSATQIIFNRTVTLKDSWGKIMAKGKK